jgi:hypothetical protein
MPPDEKVVRLKRIRIVADQLIIEPSRIVIKRPGKEREAVLEFEEELPE